MMKARKQIVIAAAILLAATTAMASWYDDYDAGLAAAKKGQWSAVIQRMSASIGGHPKEGDKERTYGAIFINYHPYYYRGVAYLQTGKYEQAISDFEKTSGPGETDLGSLSDLIQRAKTKLEAASTPEPAPQPVAPAPQPARPVPVPVAPVPAGPTIDPALRQRVAAEIGTANASLAGARNRKATSAPQYAQAIAALADANAKMNAAKNNEELNAALSSAQNAALYADSAVAPGAPPMPVAPQPRTVAATAAVFSDYTPQLRSALTNYFNGEYDDAARGFEGLTRALPKNGWVWAFLGASRYSQYAFEGDESMKAQAVSAFKNAKTYKKWNNGLPDRYFSKRIRKFFSTLG
jgi:tetratricopeptide (TPR) repeat protein